MEAVQARVQGAITKMIEDLDKEVLRKMQIDMYKCSATCCENLNYRLDDVQRCVDNCSVPVNQAQEYLQKELGTYQNRLQRCAMDCQDQVMDKAGPNTTDADAAKYRGQFEKCVMKCGETHVELVPAMFKRMREVMRSTQRK